MLLLAARAQAGAPSIPALSTVDSALVLCPAGDMTFHAIARIAPGTLAFRVFYIYADISDCVGLRLIPVPFNYDSYLTSSNGHTSIAQACDPPGAATFRLRGGGAGTGVSIPVFDSHDGTILATRTTFLSPDQNGDLIVDGQDVAAVRAKLGTRDPTADFNFDGVVTQADVDTVLAHLGHSGTGTGPVATRASSWGRIKALFR